MAELWQKVLAHLKDQLGKQNFETWIQPITFVSRDKTRLYLNVPNKFFRDWLTEHYLARIEEALSEAAQQKMAVSLDIKPEPQAKFVADKSVRKDGRERDRVHRNNNLIAKYTFENFVIGASNQFAHAASMAVANQPGDHYNPLFIYGGVGLGKTHLINGIGHRAVSKFPTSKVLYLSSE